MEYRPTGPLILTALFDPASQARFEDLRQRHFPPARNFIPAHLTLFHKLPPDKLESIAATVRREAAACAEMRFRTAGPRSLGRGVAVAIDCPGLAALQVRLAAGWGDWLSNQDRQGFRPHVTVQNKVDPATAVQTLEALQKPEALPDGGNVVALRLWEYLGGPWRLLGESPFGINSAPQRPSNK